MQRTEGDTKQMPPVSPLHSLPTSNSHELHTCALGLEAAVRPLALAPSVGARCPFSPKLPGKRVQQSRLLSAQAAWAALTRCYSVLRGGPFTRLAGADYRYLFFSPLSEGHLGRVGATVVKVFTSWKLASTFFFPPAEPAVEHSPAYLCLACSSASKNHKPFRMHKKQLFLLMVETGTECLLLIRTAPSVNEPQLSWPQSWLHC